MKDEKGASDRAAQPEKVLVYSGSLPDGEFGRDFEAFVTLEGIELECSVITWDRIDAARRELGPGIAVLPSHSEDGLQGRVAGS